MTTNQIRKDPKRSSDRESPRPTTNPEYNNQDGIQYSWSSCRTIIVSEGSVHEVYILDDLPILATAIYLLDRVYLDFDRLFTVHQADTFFVTGAKSNTCCQRIYSHPIDKSTGLVCDQTIRLTNFYAAKDYPDQLRRVRYNTILD